jgi:hypothetical protein
VLAIAGPQARQIEILERVLVGLEAEPHVRAVGRVAARVEVLVAEALEVVADGDP